MSDENVEIKNQTPVSTPEPTFSKEDLEKSFQTRLHKERSAKEAAQRDAADALSKLQDLQKKVESGKASQSESQEYYTANKAAGDASKQIQDGRMSKEEADQYVHHVINMNNIIQQVNEAKEKDPEFKDLIDADPEGKKINQQEFAYIAGLPALKNKAAVIKHLLKDEQANHIFKINESNFGNDRGAALSAYLYNLSNELENNVSKPGPSQFRPVPNLQDAGKGDDFDIDEYINDKY